MGQIELGDKVEIKGLPILCDKKFEPLQEEYFDYSDYMEDHDEYEDKVELGKKAIGNNGVVSRIVKAGNGERTYYVMVFDICELLAYSEKDIKKFKEGENKGA